MARAVATSEPSPKKLCAWCRAWCCALAALYHAPTLDRWHAALCYWAL